MIPEPDMGNTSGTWSKACGSDAKNQVRNDNAGISPAEKLRHVNEHPR